MMPGMMIDYFVFFFPEKISRKIFNYLKNHDQISLISIHPFFHQQWIQQVRVIELYKPLSELFFVEQEFREKILSKIHNPLTQLSLLDHPLSKVIDDIDTSFHVSPGLHRLEVEYDVFDYLVGKKDCYGIEKIEHLSISARSLLGEGEIINVSQLKKATQSLSLHNVILPNSLEDCLSSDLIKFALCYCEVKETDADEEGQMLILPSLPNLHTLILHGTIIKSIKEFHYLNELDLYDVIIDPEELICFQCIPNLSLIGCEGFSDLSPLQYNNRITVQDCPAVVDYSKCMMKSKIISLQFSNEQAHVLLDISSYSMVDTLRIDFSNNTLYNNQISSNAISSTLKNVTLTFLSIDIELNLFRGVKSISLEDCSGIKSLQGLEDVEKVSLVELNHLTSLNGLVRIQELEVISCPQITDFSSARSFSRVLIQSCKGFTNAEEVAEVSHLTIIHCSCLEVISPLTKVHTLILKDCCKITSIKALQNVVPILQISDCKNLRIYGTPSHFDVTNSYLKNCNGLEMIPDTVYGVVLEYLKYQERIKFLSASSYLHEVLMKKTRQIRLSRSSALDFFFMNASFLTEILEKIENPMRQLQVVASKFYKMRSDFYCPGFQKLQISIELFHEICQRSISSSSSPNLMVTGQGNDWKVDHLVLRDELRLPKVSFQDIRQYLYKAIHFLNISILEPITNLDNLSSTLESLQIGHSEETILSLPPLPNLKILSILTCNINNLHEFHYLEELFLCNVPIMDVTPLQAIQKISFHNCHLLEGISPLQSHRFIEIINCSRVREYRNTLTQCQEIIIENDAEDEDDMDEEMRIDLSHFRCVQRLILRLWNIAVMISSGLPSSLREIELHGEILLGQIFTGFDGLQRVTLDMCLFESVTELGLGSVAEVVISNLDYLTSLEGLQSTQMEATYRAVEISYCHQITDFSPLNYLQKVSIMNCDGFRNGAQVDHVHELLIDNCSNLRDVRMLRNIPKLEIKNCQKILYR